MTEREVREYESDSEVVLRPSAMCRREASDDEEDGGERSAPVRDCRRIGVVVSDVDSEVHRRTRMGGWGESEDEEDGRRGGEGEAELRVGELEAVVYGENGEGGRCRDAADIPEGVDSGGDGRGLSGEKGDYCGKDQLEEKEKEPFAVPTAGAFYMHDDRFGGDVGVRHNRAKSGHKLRESEDDQKWVLDRFKEMNIQDLYHEAGRMSNCSEIMAEAVVPMRDP